MAGALPSGRTWGSRRGTKEHAAGAASSHTQAAVRGHSVTTSSRQQPLELSATDNLIQYVYLDQEPAQADNAAAGLVGNGEIQGVQGELLQTGGSQRHSLSHPMGPLPPKGGWTRLKDLS